MAQWLSTNANLLSGLAGVVTVLAVLLPLLTHNKYGLGALSRRIAGDKAGGHDASTKPAHATSASLGPRSVAVMAFDSLSNDASHAYIADGISCEIIAVLGRPGHLQLAPRADTFALRGKALSLAEIGKQLGVRYVVQGSVRQDANKLRIIAEFGDASTAQQVWSKTYDRDLTDVLKVQEEIAQSVAGSVGGAAYRAEVINAPPSTRNVDAWSLTQKARHEHMKASDAATKERAIELVRSALRLDPDYALASAMLAYLLMDLVANGQAANVPQFEAQARVAIEHAMHTGADQAEVLFYAGNVWLELGEREQSESALRRGTRLLPHDLMQQGFLARTLALGTLENAAEAVTIVDRTLELAPEHPLAWTWEMFKGLACLNLERYEEARTLLRSAAEDSPKFVRVLMLLTCATGAVGDSEEAQRVFARAQQINSKLTADRFASYIRRITRNPDTAGRITLGLAKAGLLSPPADQETPKAQI